MNLVGFEFLIRKNLEKETKSAIENLNNLRIDRISKLNFIWTRALKNSEFYRKYKKNYSLPKTIHSISELNCFPPITKEDLKNNKDIILSDYPNLPLISTGGSTGEPLLFPFSKKDSSSDLANRFAIRKLWGLPERPRTLKIWGHSDIFGSGIVDKFKSRQKRKIIDFNSNQLTDNAYLTDEKNLQLIFQNILTFRPKLLIGYTSTIKNLAIYIIENKNSKELKFTIKLIVVTSENTDKKDIDLIKKAFNCEVAIEYGMAETGVVAYSLPKSQNLNIFRKSFIASSHNNQLNLTCLDRVFSFPLIRYQTGDYIDENHEDLTFIKSINGRIKETIFLKNIAGIKLRFSVIGITHILKSKKGIIAVQCHCNDNNFLTKIDIAVDNNFNESINNIRSYFKCEIQNELKQKIDLDLLLINFKRFNSLIKNKKGTLATLVYDYKN